MGVYGINWTICKQSAPRSRQLTTPTPHHSIFTGRMLFLTPDQQCHSTEGSFYIHTKIDLCQNRNVSFCCTKLNGLGLSNSYTYYQYSYVSFNTMISTCTAKSTTQDWWKMPCMLFKQQPVVQKGNIDGLLSTTAAHRVRRAGVLTCGSCHLERSARQHPHRGWSCQVPKTAKIRLF